MPTVTMTFNLPEERSELADALRANELISIIDEIRNRFRSKVKHQEEQATTWTEARDLIVEVLGEHDYFE